MDPLDSLHLQLRLEGKDVVDQMYLRQVEVIPEEDIPLILLARLADGNQVAYYDERISSDLQQELAARIQDLEFSGIDPLLAILTKHNMPVKVEHYKTYRFPSMPPIDQEVQCLPKHDPRVIDFGFDGLDETVYAIAQDNKLVSACVSARENETCGEAWVYTDPDYRHQGLAQKVVNAWAANLLNVGKVPFYSHKIENLASANLAAKFGLQPMFEEIAITQIQ